MYVILVYDIKSDDGGAKALSKTFKICKKYLTHIQNSVFEGELSEAQLLKLKMELKPEIREDRDYKQSDIAKVLGTTQQQYSKYELGIQLISVERLVKLAKFYNTSVDYLIGLTNERRAYPRIK